MRVETTQGRAEIVPPPKRVDRPPDSVPVRLSPINSPRPIPKALDSAEIVRHKLEELYASLQRPPEPSGAESELAAAPGVLPGQAAFDLTEMAEAKLADMPSSGELQRTREGLESDEKK